MLNELSTFALLTKQEKFNLVNLPEVAILSSSNAEAATLCDVCLTVPSIREWTDAGEVRRLCQLVFNYKRVCTL